MTVVWSAADTHSRATDDYGLEIMNLRSDRLAHIRATNQAAAFNQWCGIEVTSAESGKVEIAMPWQPEIEQYSAFLQAGLIGALIDTACGFAAATMVGSVLASHDSVNFLRKAVGERFVARARVVKPGKSQVFAACELYAVAGGAERLVATGETLLSVASGGTEARVPRNQL